MPAVGKAAAAWPLVPGAALLAAVLSIQYGATLAQGLFPTLGAEGTTSVRLGIGALILGVLMRPWRARLSRRAAPALFGYGASLAAMNLLFYMALSRIPLGVAVALEFSGPLLVSALSSRRRLDFAWIGLAAGGVALLSPAVRASGPLDWTGVALALGAGGCWALYIVFGQAAGKSLGSQATALGMLIAAALVAPVGLLRAGTAMCDPSILPAAIAVGVFSSALPFSLEMVALRGMPARTYGVLTSIEPGIGAIVGLMLLHQRLLASQWAGIGVVVAAAMGAAATIKAPTRTNPE